MNTLLIFDLYQHDTLSQTLCASLNAQPAQFEMRLFPDGETYIHCQEDIKNKSVILLAQLHQPNEKLLPLLLLADTLKDLGAHSVGLIAPYLSYMRQDTRFKPGEGITSKYFANILNQHLDWLLTVDPHLHRYASLDEIYRIPAKALSAVEVIAAYIKSNIKKPVIIGPDGESEQWAATVAKLADCPYEVLSKKRFGDRDIQISLPHAEHYQSHQPVLVDDIISTGKTMMLASQHLEAAGLSKPICIGVHAVFAQGAYEEMIQQGLTVLTCNSIPHVSNQIDLAGLISANTLELIP